MYFYLFLIKTLLLLLLPLSLLSLLLLSLLKHYGVHVSALTSFSPSLAEYTAEFEDLSPRRSFSS